MTEVFAVIGFGEAGRAFALGWAMEPERLRAYDVAIHDEERAPSMYAAFATGSVTGCSSASEAVSGARAVFCMVPTDQATAAAEAIAPHLEPGAVWLDGSSSAPSTKRHAAKIIGEGQGVYVDMAIMAPVHPKLHRTPVLLSGPDAEAAEAIALSLEMNARVIGKAVGDASAVKMLRSIIVKGMEALTAECFLAARKAGVEDLVVDSLAASDQRADWRTRARYNLGRMSEHGARRAAEMREVAKTLDDLDMPNWMATASAQWQDHLSSVGRSDVGELPSFLDDLLAGLR